MIRCPECGSARVILVLSLRRARCTRCGTTWFQDGPYQDRIRTLDVGPEPAAQPVPSSS